MKAKNYAVPTYRNTEPMVWWELLNIECRKLGIGERCFDEAEGAYRMGESPETAAWQFKAMED